MSGSSSSLIIQNIFLFSIAATDYGNFLANETPPISTSTISEKATAKLVAEFDYIRSNAVEPLSTFLDYMTCVTLPTNPCVNIHLQFLLQI